MLFQLIEHCRERLLDLAEATASQNDKAMQTDTQTGEQLQPNSLSGRQTEERQDEILYKVECNAESGNVLVGCVKTAIGLFCSLVVYLIFKGTMSKLVKNLAYLVIVHHLFHVTRYKLENWQVVQHCLPIYHFSIFLCM